MACSFSRTSLLRRKRTRYFRPQGQRLRPQGQQLNILLPVCVLSLRFWFIANAHSIISRLTSQRSRSTSQRSRSRMPSSQNIYCHCTAAMSSVVNDDDDDDDDSNNNNNICISKLSWVVTSEAKWWPTLKSADDVGDTANVARISNAITVRMIPKSAPELLVSLRWHDRALRLTVAQCWIPGKYCDASSYTVKARLDASHLHGNRCHNLQSCRTENVSIKQNNFRSFAPVAC